MKKLPWLCLVVTIFLGEYPGEALGQTKQVILKVLDPFVELYLEEENRVLKYCPETPCEVILVHVSISEEVLFDFATLFYLFNTDYPEFKDPDYPMPSGFNPALELKKFLPDILRKYLSIGVCQDSSQTETGVERCLLRYLKHRNHIQTILITESG